MRDVLFADRTDAGRQLAKRLDHLRGENIAVLGLPRGGVPVALEVARALGAPLDVIVVRKLGVPSQPELGMGAIGEDGVRIINHSVMGSARVTTKQLAVVESRERVELERRAMRFRGNRPRVSVEDRTAVVVDDGIATGSTARAACEVARAHGASKVVLAVPVAPADWRITPGEDADEFVCVEAPIGFMAIGQWYEDFTQTSDDEVLTCLDQAATWRPAHRAGPSGLASGAVNHLDIPVGSLTLGGDLTVPDPAVGLVVFAHGSGSSRLSPRNQFVAEELNRAGFATLLVDLLTPVEERDRDNVFDIEMLATRLVGVTKWISMQPDTSSLRIGYFGASTGAAAALRAATEPPTDIAAVVSRGGRPDLAAMRLPLVTSPTRLIVGGDDHVVLDLNRKAQAMLRCESDLVVVDGATHLFEEPGALEKAAELARVWFSVHLPTNPAGRREGAGKAPPQLDPVLDAAREEAEGVDVFGDPFAAETLRVQREEAEGMEVFSNPDDVVPASALKQGSPGHESLVWDEGGLDQHGEDEVRRPSHDE